jgi:hypothetical protein
VQPQETERLVQEARYYVAPLMCAHSDRVRALQVDNTRERPRTTILVISPVFMTSYGCSLPFPVFPELLFVRRGEPCRTAEYGHAYRRDLTILY